MPQVIDFVTWSQNRDVIGCACLPDEITRRTGFMLVVHGYANRRELQSRVPRGSGAEGHLANVGSREPGRPRVV